MKGSLIFLFTLIFGMQSVLAQNAIIRPPALGVSFILSDYTTPQLIRSQSLAKVFQNKAWAKFNQLGSGLALHYFQGLAAHVDFAATIGGSFVKNVASNDNSGTNNFLIETDASLNLKLFTDNYWFTPYLSAGVGASKYLVYYGAIIPIGIGVKLNLFDEAALFISSQFRIPVTNQTNNYHFVHSIGLAGVIGQRKGEALKEIP